MANEMGHACIVERFQQLLCFVQSFGASYNPTNANLTVSNLQAKLIEAKMGIDGVRSNLAPNKEAIIARETTYECLEKTITRVLNYCATIGANEINLTTTQTFVQRIQDRCKTAALSDGSSIAEHQTSACYSASQYDYNHIIEYLDKLIRTFSSDARYTPIESELSVSKLEKLSRDLKVANQAVMNTYTHLKKARIVRDEALYAKLHGIVDTAQLVKKYVKAVYGENSNEFRQIDALEFKNI